MVQKDVLRLNVTVDGVARVKVLHGLKHLAEDFPFLLLLLLPWVVHEKLLQGLTVTVLHGNVHDFHARV